MVFIKLVEFQVIVQEILKIVKIQGWLKDTLQLVEL